MKSGNSRQSTSYRFAEFRFVPGDGLYAEGERLRLPPKETLLLGALLRAAGDIVSHQTIEAELWPRQTIGYASVARCVYSLRKILRESGTDCLQTVHKRGYRISVPVTQESTGAGVPVALDSAQTRSALAYSHYLAARREGSLPRPEKLALAARFFEMAVEEDPQYCAALAGLADVRMYQSVRGFIPSLEALSGARDACLRALAVDEEHVQSLAVLGWFEGIIGQRFREGLALVDKALELDPNYAPAYAYRSHFSRGAGDIESAVHEQLRGVSTDPHSLLNRHGLAFVSFHSGDFQVALDMERELAARYPDDDTCHLYRALFAAHLGIADEALRAASRAMELSGHLPGPMALVANVEALVGSPQRAETLVRRALAEDLPYCAKPFAAAPLLVLGQRDEAFALLKQSKQEHCPWFFGCRTDLRLASLFEDPRAVDLYNEFS